MSETIAARTKTGAPAWNELYVLAGMRGLSFAGDIVAETSIVLSLQAKGASSYTITLLLLAATLPPVLLSPITGRIADRFDSRRLIVVVALLQALVCVAMTISIAPAPLIILSVLLSAGLAFTHPVFGGLPRPMVGTENVARASSISQGTAMAGMVAAPAIGGFLTGHLGIRPPLLIDAASFVAVALGGLYIKTRLHARRGAGAAGSEEAKDEPYQIRSDRFLRSVLILSGAVMAAASMVNVLIVFYVRETFHASEGVFGIVVSAWMIGLIPGAIIVNRAKKVPHDTMLVATFVCIGVAIVGVGLAPTVWWVIPFYVLGGIGNGAQATVTHVLLNLRVPDSHRGRAFAALGAVSNSGPTLGFVLGGAVLSFVSPRAGFLIAGILALATVVLFAHGVLSTSGSVADDPSTNAEPHEPTEATELPDGMPLPGGGQLPEGEPGADGRVGADA